MSHAGPPSDPPPPDPNEGGTGGDASGQQPYNPYPDNWTAPAGPSGQPGPESPYGQPDPYGQSNPYGQANPYGQQPSSAAAGQPQPGAPGSPPNPYAGPMSTKATFGFGGYAGWLTRVAAYLIDSITITIAGAPLWIGYAILIANTTTTTNPDGTTTTDYSGSAAVPLVLILIGAITSLAFFIWNICIRQGRTGASVGKSVLAVRLVNSDLQPIGGGLCFLRQILHIVDTIPCYLGYLWPIWDSHRQTFSDKIMSTYVIHATTQPPQPY